MAVSLHSIRTRFRSVVQNQKAVTAYFSSEQLLPFVFAEHRYPLSAEHLPRSSTIVMFEIKIWVTLA